MKKQKIKILIGLLAIIPLIIFSYQETDENQLTRTHEINVVQEKEVMATNKSKNQPIVRAAQNDQATLTHQQIIETTNRFMETLVQDVDTQYKVKKMQTKEELIRAFDYLATRDVVKTYVDYYYREKEDGLYIVPTETPPWFVENEPYQKKWIKDNICLITQHNQSDLYGDYVINIEMTYKQEKWKITKINHNNQNNVTIEANQAI
ncbi:hypothetical protein BN1058_02552 [Paraliobacillus sp. PM-2]|uniref:hypothetical protein n=1 Tax=Paraliobacillus sp. PM-2 TaxID=1462524 RepID=UPI00061BBA79|nr:hypothetical protein [Paraliobacillus sp. PM-2]CQR48200.1 hypothetical protein BN1058_02552 [Paraliobacillus sp. PM-2]